MVEVYVNCWHPAPEASRGLEGSHLTTKQQGEAVQEIPFPLMSESVVCRMSDPAREVKVGLEGSMEHEAPSVKNTERRWPLGLLRVRLCVVGVPSATRGQGRV